MYDEVRPFLKKKSNFRARGSRGGTRKRRERQQARAQFAGQHSVYHPHASHHYYPNSHHYGDASFQGNTMPNKYTNSLGSMNFPGASSCAHTIESRERYLQRMQMNLNMNVSSNENQLTQKPVSKNQTQAFSQIAILPSSSNTKSFGVIENLPSVDEEIKISLTASTSVCTEDEVSGEFDLYETIHPVDKNVDLENEKKSYQCYSSESFFVTSPRSFLLR